MQAQQEVTAIRRKRSGASKRPRLSLTMATTSSGDVFSDRLSPSSSDSGLVEDDDEEDMANCLILLARGSSHPPPPPPPPPAADAYPCKTCNKSFPSFQALGGHRASHKRPHNNKPMMTVDDKKPDSQSDGRDHDSGANNVIYSHQQIITQNNKSRVHECSICGAEFGSGQALGGHMRRHRPINIIPAEDTKRQRNNHDVLSLDLNLPAPEDHEPNKIFPFASKVDQQVMIFSASPLVDCHY